MLTNTSPNRKNGNALKSKGVRAAAMKALIRKDLQNVTSDRRTFSSLLAVPLIMTVILPVIFILASVFAADDPDLAGMLNLLPEFADRAGETGVAGGTGGAAGSEISGLPGGATNGAAYLPQNDLAMLVASAMMNYVMPLFFLMIPIMASSIMAGSSFVGEKEKHTLETLLYSPLAVKDVFRAKVAASFLLSMLVSLISLASTWLVVEILLIILLDSVVLPGLNWLIILLLLSPALSLLAIVLIVKVSAKAKSVEESQQRSVFMILPLILLVAGQFAGVMLLSPLHLLIAGAVCALAAGLLLKNSLSNCSCESLLRQV